MLIWRHIVVLLLAFMMGVGPGFSEALAKERKRIQLNVKERKKEKREKKEPPGLRRSAVVALQIEAKLIKGINKTTEYLNKTANSLPPKSAQRLQILEKVLNLYMENASYVRNEEERTYDRQWRAWDAGGRKGVEPKLRSNRSFGLWKRVINQATRINKEYPRNKNADVVLYNKAVGLQYIGREKDSARILSQIVEKYKGSNIAGDAYASLGDYYFDRNDFRNARNNYKRATAYRRSKRYLWSIFKLGWCAYNLGQYRESMRQWKSVVAKARYGGKQGEQLKEEALRDLVYAFAELKQVDAAIAYYRANGGSRFIGPFLTLLGEILSDQGQYAQAVQVYKRFQKVAPLDPEGPQAQKEIINLFYITGKLGMVWRELAILHQRYYAGSAWAKKNEKSLVEDTEKLIKDQIMYYSTLTHQKAIKDNNRALNSQAKKGYLLYLQFYPKSKEVPGVKFLIGDIDYYLKNFQSAGRYYYEIAALGKQKALRINPANNKAENIHRQSSVLMVGAYVKDFEPEFRVLKKRTPDFSKPKALSVKARNYIKACANYVKWYPKDMGRVKSCDKGIATIFYRSGIRKQALKYLKIVAKKYSTQKEGPNAVRLVIPMVKDDKVLLAATSSEFLQVPAYQKGKIGNLLRGLQRGAEKEAITKETDTLKRAKKYEAQARKYPKDPDVDKLWFNAAVDYMKAGAVDDSLRAHGVIVKRFPKTPQAKESLLTIARVQEKRLEFPQASASYLAFNKRYPKDKDAAPSLGKACELQAALNSPKALSVCTALARRYPDAAIVYIERLISGAYRSKSYSRMAQLITKVYFPIFKLSPNQKVLGWKRIYDASGGKGGMAATARNNMIGIYQSAPGSVEGEALRAIGEFSLARALTLVPKYHAIKLKGGTVDHLAASIQNKAVALNQLEGAFKEVLGVKDAYSGVASYVQLGQANEAFAEALANPPAIKGASKEDVLKELGPQIAERKKAAFSWYKAAMDIVSQYNVYSAYSIKAIDGVARIRGSRFSFADYVVPADFMGNEVPSSWAGDLKGED